jgi:RND family efflux transporter MFP subunit
MRKSFRLSFLILGMLVIVAGGIWFFTRSRLSAANDAASSEEATPVAQVETAQIERKAISETITAYGTVVAQPGKTHSLSVSFEVRVRHVLVAPGQEVKPGDPLVEIEASSSAQLLLQQAEGAAQTAEEELKQTLGRYNLKLATNQELSQAQKTARDAEAQLQSLRKQGVGTNNTIRSDMNGLVLRVAAQDGQVVPAGNPLVELIAAEETEVRLGVEPEDLANLQLGQSIALTLVNAANDGPVDGKLRLITHEVDPSTRLVDVFVALPPGRGLILGGYVRGEIQTASQVGLVVPRSAVLPDDGGYSLFTIADGHAVKHSIKTGRETATGVEVRGGDLREGESVVTAGNYELQNGMAVTTETQK